MKKVIIIKELHPMFLTMMQFLNRTDIEVDAVETSDDMLRSHFNKQADLIIAKIDQDGMTFETMEHVIRRNEALRKVSILVMHDNTPSSRERCEKSGANAFMALTSNTATLASRVREYLDVTPRRAYRVVLNMTVEGYRNNKPFLCRSENISTHGMLINTKEILAADSRMSCSFYLPDGTRISVEGEVARVVKQESANSGNQYGIRFLTISDASKNAIESFVHKERSASVHGPTDRDALVA
ncbi:MAG: PilZ domain-containing protein [Nitrospirota bacterium]|nr:PilZ domain-containing protein [Nitrospirota bacterium]